VGGYLVLGAIGLPVFAGFKGGFGVLGGPTGGCRVGFFIAAALVGLIRMMLTRKVHGFYAVAALDVLSVVVAVVVYYAVGAWWFALSTGATIQAAFAVCILPFLVPDALKAAAAFICAQPIRVALGRTAWRKLPADAKEQSH
jgi:biotin transport system substrate-specific component